MPGAALSSVSIAALTVAGCSALANWWAVTVDRRVVEWIAKPLVMIALIVAAATLDPTDGAVRAWVIAGLVCSLAGDVFLMLPRERFVEGLSSFFVAHLAYLVAFVLSATSVAGAVVGVAIAAVALALVGPMIFSAVSDSEPKLVVPVVGYMGVISLMVIAAWSTMATWSIVGAMSFFASDGVLAVNKFVRKLPAGRFAIMSTYHLAQFCFVIAVTR